MPIPVAILSGQTQVIKDPVDIRNRLRELWIPENVIFDARRAWRAAAASATDFEPSTASGTKGWMGGVGVLREGLKLVKPSWEPVNRQNWPLSLSPHEDLAVTATSGDGCTGCDYP